jgi:hypothetical protein
MFSPPCIAQQMHMFRPIYVELSVFLAGGMILRHNLLTTLLRKIYGTSCYTKLVIDLKHIIVRGNARALN